ncbi:MAG: glycosyltransferase family 4 protein [Bacteroidota bacterium]
MGKLKILFLASTDHTNLHGGYSVAVSHIEQQLNILDDTSIITTTNATDLEPVISYTNKQENGFETNQIVQDLIRINVDHQIDPYLYFTARTKKINSDKESSVINLWKSYTSEVLKRVETYPFDLIYAHDWPTFDIAKKLKNQTGRPLVTHIHSLDLDRILGSERSWVYEVEKEVLAFSDHIIAVSHYTREMICTHYDISRTKISTVYNAVDRTFYNRSLIKQNEQPFRQVLFVGRLTEQKNAMAMIDIAEKVLSKDTNVRFVIAGDGELRDAMVDTAASKNIGGNIHFTGFLPKDKLRLLYAQSDVLCMPSRSEPFGLVALEAASMEIPVVLSMQSGAKEVLPDALVADCNHVEKFADHILTVLDHPQKSKEMILNNSRALKNIRWDNTAQNVLAILSKVASQIS